jgi:hypothetical protein
VNLGAGRCGGKLEYLARVAVMLPEN